VSSGNRDPDPSAPSPAALERAIEQAVDGMMRQVGLDPANPEQREATRCAILAGVTDPTSTGREATAVHEAGHAVAAYVLGYGVREMRLLADNWAYTRPEHPETTTIWPFIPIGRGYRPMTEDEARQRGHQKWLRAYTVMMMAGQAAASRYTGVDIAARLDFSTDLLNAARAAGLLIPEPAAALQYVVRARTLAYCLLGRARCWQAVKALGRVLAERGQLAQEDVAAVLRPILGGPGGALGAMGRA
jgi:hypothetical protein